MVEVKDQTPFRGLKSWLTALCVLVFFAGVHEVNSQVIFDSGPINVAIPDNDPGGVTHDIVVSSGGGFAINDLNIIIQATHTWVGDLRFVVTHVDSGIIDTVIDRPGYTTTGFGCSANNIDVELDDEGGDGPVEDMCATDPALFGSPTPFQPLSIFDGQNIDGTWRISVIDNAGGDTGELTYWALVAILPGSSFPPTLAGIPDVSFLMNEDDTVDLDDYASDPEDPDSVLTFTAAVLSVVTEQTLVPAHVRSFKEMNEITGEVSLREEFVPSYYKVITRFVETDTSDLDIDIDPVTHVATFSASDDSTGEFVVMFRATDSDTLSDTDTISVSVLRPPTISISEDEFEVAVSEGDTVLRSFTISNLGDVELNFTITKSDTEVTVSPKPRTSRESMNTGSGDVEAVDFTSSPDAVPAPFGQLPLTERSLTDVTITHSVDPVTITPLQSVSCNAGGLHADNGYYRAFDLPSFGIFGDFNVTEVEIGIETATGAAGDQPIDVNLYVSPTTFPLPVASLTLISSTPVIVPDQAGTLFQIPVTGTIPAGSELVVEIFTPDGQTAGHSFFIGANAAGQTGPSYIAAAACGLNDPGDLAGIGFPDMHIVMSVTGNEGSGGGPLPWLNVSPTSGTLDPASFLLEAGSSIDIDLTFFTNDSGLVVPAEGYLIIASDDPEDPIEDVRVAIVDSVVSVGSNGSHVPDKVTLHQNFPNPFNPSTTIRYDLTKTSKVSLKIYDILGQEVRTLVSGKQSSGVYNVKWDGKNNLGNPVSSGVYVYRIEAAGFVSSRKMMFLK